MSSCGIPAGAGARGPRPKRANGRGIQARPEKIGEYLLKIPSAVKSRVVTEPHGAGTDLPCSGTLRRRARGQARGRSGDAPRAADRHRSPTTRSGLALSAPQSRNRWRSGGRPGTSHSCGNVTSAPRGASVSRLVVGWFATTPVDEINRSARRPPQEFHGYLDRSTSTVSPARTVASLESRSTSPRASRSTVTGPTGK